MKNFLTVRNNRGGLLIITLTFILVFTLLGFASIRLAGTHKLLAENRKASEQAFWLADGAVERARVHLPQLYSLGDYQDIFYGEGTYDMSSEKDVILDANGNEIGTHKYRWVVNTQGEVNNQTRGIKAILSSMDTSFNIMTRGSIKHMDQCPMASVNIDCDLIKEYQQFDLDTYFDGFSKQDIYDMAAQKYLDPQNANDINLVEEITFVTLKTKTSLNITTDNIQCIKSDGVNCDLDSNGYEEKETVFLIVDASELGDTAQITIAGNPVFKGIIWIIGESRLTGTTIIEGAVLVEGNAELETPLSGNLTLKLDQQAVEDAVGFLGTSALFLPRKPRIIHWEEV